MLEVELKFRAVDRAAAVATLLEWGAALTQDRSDIDLYFQAPDRDLKASDEAFRLRRVGNKNYLTYKGPRRDSETKTRTEIEVPLGEGDGVAADAESLFAALGYAPVAHVRKKRRVYKFTREEFPIEVCFDILDRVGEFVELEILADEGQYQRAKTVLLAAAADLGLTVQEPRSYLGLVLALGGPEGSAPLENG